MPITIPVRSVTVGFQTHLPARALVNSPVSMPRIAALVGHESEAAFDRAFSREWGMPPARYRLSNRKSGDLSRAGLAVGTADGIDIQ